MISRVVDELLFLFCEGCCGLLLGLSAVSTDVVEPCEETTSGGGWLFFDDPNTLLKNPGRSLLNSDWAFARSPWLDSFDLLYPTNGEGAAPLTDVGIGGGSGLSALP